MLVILNFLHNDVENVPSDAQICLGKRHEVLAIIGEYPNAVL